jgi:transposase
MSSRIDFKYAKITSGIQNTEVIMAYKIGNQMQSMFLPSAVDDYVSRESPVRVYDAFVDSLNFHKLGISLEPSMHGGADQYYPKQLLKLLIYGYSYGIRSSRKLERACHDNLSFIWLMGELKPDYRTISRFRSQHKEAIKKVLKQCVQMCVKLNLIEGNIFFTDGSKFRANASINNTRTKEGYQQYIKYLEEHIGHVIDESEQIDAKEKDDRSLIKLKEQVHDKAKLINKMKDVLNTLDAQDKENINSTDGDSVKAKSRQGTHASYNVQSTTDAQHGLIVQAEAVNRSNDYNQLSAQIKQASEVIGKTPEHICADAGYADVEDLKKINPSVNVIVPSHRQAQEENGHCCIRRFDKQHFVYDPQTDVYICPEGKRLKFESFPSKNKKRYRASGAVCQVCPQFGDPQTGKCTGSLKGRCIIRLAEEAFKEQLEANYKRPENQDIYKLRKQTVEHPFGHMKRNLGAGQFMLRGLPKVNAEVSLLATCFNIARMMTIVGIGPLMEQLAGNFR